MKTKKRSALVLTCLFTALLSCCFCIEQVAAESQTLDIGSLYKPPISNTEGTGIMDMIIRDAFNRIGVKVQIILVASTNALKKANEGLYDGDMMRIDGVDKYYPNLIQVPESVYQFGFAAFAKDVNISLAGWEDLKPYRVIVPTGWVETDNNVNEENTRTLSRTGNPFKMFNALAKGEADIIIYERMMGYELIRELGMSDIHIIEPPLSSRDMFLYLHKKHADLVPKVTKALKDMKDDGTFKKIKEEAMAKYKEILK